MRALAIAGIASLVLGCAGVSLEGAVEAANRACDAADALAAEPALVDPEDLEEAQAVCRVMRALAGGEP